MAPRTAGNTHVQRITALPSLLAHDLGGLRWVRCLYAGALLMDVTTLEHLVTVIRFAVMLFESVRASSSQRELGYGGVTLELSLSLINLSPYKTACAIEPQIP